MLDLRQQVAQLHTRRQFLKHCQTGIGAIALGSLLAAFASLSLLPVEMHIETRDAEARDTLWLSSAGKARPSKPSEVDRHALDTLLQRAVHS